MTSSNAEKKSEFSYNTAVRIEAAVGAIIGAGLGALTGYAVGSPTNGFRVGIVLGALITFAVAHSRKRQGFLTRLCTNS